MGRKKSIILFDAISMALSYSILIFAQNFWQFLIANIIASFGIINTIAQHCYLAEDVDPRDRVFTYNFLEILFIVSAFFAPVAGILVGRYGMIPAVRFMCAFALLCTLIFISLKVIFLKETSIGKLKAKEARNAEKKEIFVSFWRALRYVMKNRKLAILLVINISVSFASALNTIYYFLYLTGGLKYNEASISLFPFITSVIALITLLFIIPSGKNSSSLVSAGFLLYIIGAVSLVAAPLQGSLLFVLVNVVCWAFSNQIAGTYLQAEIANAIEDNMRADVMGFSNAFSMLALFPTGIVGGILYKFSPVILFYFILLIYEFGFALFLIGTRKEKTAELSGQSNRNLQGPLA
jgi:MFS family permease